MLESRAAKGLKLLYLKKPGPFDAGRIGERLPEAYRKFWNEWKIQKPAAVHFIPEPGKWRRNPTTGEVTPVQNIPIPLKFPKESNKHLWGGEGVIQGYQKRHPTKRRVPHFWVPQLKRSVVYSEILNKHMSVIVTERTIELIHENYGFDHYILKTPACDLRSELALRIKRNLLLSLYKKELYPDDPEKQEEVYNKYKDYLSPYSEEEVEWYGLTYIEALRKLLREEAEQNQPQPMKLQYRSELVEQLINKGIGAGGSQTPELQDRATETSSWLSKMNPFGGKKHPSTQT